MKQWTVRDVMTTKVVTVREDTPYKEMVDLLAEHQISAVPVVDAAARVVGVVSEADLLRKVEFLGEEHERRIFERPSRRTARAKAHGDTAGTLMTVPATTVQPDVALVAAAKLMDAERVKRLPVVDDQGRLVGLVSRRDLIRMYLRPDPDIRADVVDGVFKRTLWFDPVGLEVDVADGVVTLQGQVDRKTTAEFAARLSEAVPGVVRVVDELRWEHDDTQLAQSRFYRSHPFSSTDHQPQ